MARGGRSAPRKQRHTARRVWQRLVAERGADLAESTARAFVAGVRAELGEADRDVAIVQEHGPGAESEVDFGEFEAQVAGTGRGCGCSARLLDVTADAKARVCVRQARTWPAAGYGCVWALVTWRSSPPAATRSWRSQAATRVLLVVGNPAAPTPATPRCAAGWPPRRARSVTLRHDAVVGGGGVTQA